MNQLRKMPPTEKTRKWKVLLLDDHPVVLEALALRIDQEEDLVVCASVREISQAFAAVEKSEPDVCILDLSLPDGHGLELLKNLHARYPELRIVVFTMHEENLYGERVLQAGARGYITKHETADAVLNAIRRVLNGEIAVSPTMATRLVRTAIRQDQTPRTGVERLSDRELEIFQLLGRGMDTKEIAGQLKRSVKTVETFRGRIKKKLSIRTLSELIAQAAHWSAQRPT
jgi:DNA-binding NarL/FixJ family response regulator